MIIFQFSDILLQGLLITLYVCILGILLGMVIGAFVCLLKLTRFKFLIVLTNIYIDFFRGTPYLIQVYIIYYVGPAFGLDLSAFAVGVISLAIYGGAYFAEIYRGGVLSVPIGQIESARALGLSNLTITICIVIPQMIGLILAPFTNQTITLIKESAILSVITLEELTFSGERIIGETFRYVEVYSIIAISYWALITFYASISARMEKFATRYLRVGTIKS